MSEETNTVTPTEYVWKTDVKDFSEPIFDANNEKCNTEEGDNRQDENILPVTLKKAFTVQLFKKQWRLLLHSILYWIKTVLFLLTIQRSKLGMLPKRI